MFREIHYPCVHDFVTPVVKILFSKSPETGGPVENELLLYPQPIRTLPASNDANKIFALGFDQPRTGINYGISHGINQSLYIQALQTKNQKPKTENQKPKKNDP